MDRRDVLLGIGLACAGGVTLCAGLLSISHRPHRGDPGRRIGPISAWLKPGFGACGRCRTNWGFVEGHTTNFIFCEGDEGAFDFKDSDMKNAGSGAFPLCEKCWSELTPAERLPFYRAMFEEWQRQHIRYAGGLTYADPDRAWRVIERSVLHERPDQGPRIWTTEDGVTHYSTGLVRVIGEPNPDDDICRAEKPR